jgi:hypothetical protein
MAGKKSVFARREIVAAIIAGAVSIVVLIVILRREPQATPPASSETVAPQLQLPPPIRFDSTRYIINDPGYPWLDDPDRELIELLDERARRTMDALERIQQFEVRKRFTELHNRNIKALRGKRRRVSHDLVSEIRTLLSPFQPPIDPGTTPEDEIQKELSMRRLAREVQKKESKAETSSVTTPK